MISPDARDWIATFRNLILCGGILSCTAVALLPGVATFFGIRGLRALKRKSVPYLHLTRFYFYRVNRATTRVSEMVARPIIVTASATERLRTYWNEFTTYFRHQE